MVAFILPANSASSGGDFVTNSLRFNDSDAAFISRTPSETNKKTWTWSAWIKRSDITTAQNLLTAGNDVNNRCHLDINASGTFQVEAKNGGTSVMKCEGGRHLRDPNAWMHLVWRVDTTQGTASDRMRIYINGAQFTFSSNSFPDQNINMEMNVNVLHAIGKRTWADQNYYDGYLAEVHFVDGTSTAPTVFGEYNDNDVWIPKDCKDDITYGTNGYYLQFKETGTGTNSSGMGADTSGNNNHFAVSGFTALDITTDTPMNNFCTLNSLDTYASSGGVLSEGNLKLAVTTGELHTAVGTIAPTKGKWYWEIMLDNTDGSNPSGLGITNLDEDDKSNMPSKKTWGFGYMASTGNKQNNANNSSYGNSYTSNDKLSVAMDLDNGAVYFAKNGTFQASGDPTSGASKTNAAFTFTTGGSYAPWIADNTSGVAFTWLANFGNPPFSGTDKSDANGFGSFEYTVPSGYFALCTRNLAQYG